MAQAIRLRVRSHDAYQLEFKVDYSLLPNHRSRYTVDIYLFIPHSLDINSRTYTQTDFYRDAKNYVRLRTPLLRLDALATAPRSPLVTCEQIVETPNWYHDETLLARLTSSLKVMRPVLNASLRAQVRRIAARVSASSTNPNQVEMLIEELLDRIQVIVKRYRSLCPRVLEAGRESRIAAVYRLTDEAISLVVEDALVRTYRVLDRYPDETVATCLQEQIAEQSKCELNYREEHNYGTVPATERDGETYLHRASLLKKFTISALFLTTSVSREGTTTEQVLYAMAAGLSMVFATVVAFYSQARFGMLTFPLFVALVVAYMFKDRIKEVGRLLFARYIRRFFYDQRTVLRTLDDQHKLGFVREKAYFVTQKDVPPAVIAQRQNYLPEGVSSSDLEEDILHYSKRLLIDKDAFRHIHVGALELTGIRDIIRYNVRPYLRQMAGPLSLRYYLEDGELRSVWCHKTYQLYFVIEYGPSDDKERTRRQLTVVHLDRNGIIRIEPGRTYSITPG